MIRSLTIFAFAACAAFSQVAQQANEHLKTEEQRANLAKRLTAAERDARQKPKDVAGLMELSPGMTVADVGTGPGYMLPYLSEAVGPTGRVIAQDIFSDFLGQARKRAAEHKLSNVSYVEGNEKDAKLPAGEVDVILVLDTYHHFDYPADMLASLKRALKPGGRLIIVEYHKKPEAMNGNAMTHVRLGADDAIREIESNGFRLVSRREHEANVQWIAVFRKAA